MFPFLLYLCTALVTGWQVLLPLVANVWLAPLPDVWTNILLLSWLPGSLAMLLAAGISLFRPRVAACVACIGLLVNWVTYGPVLVGGGWGMNFLIDAAYALLGLVLALVTAYALVASVRDLSDGLGRDGCFPSRPGITRGGPLERWCSSCSSALLSLRRCVS